MDNISTEFKLNCNKHTFKEIEFIQINETLNVSQKDNLFYCNFCVNEDSNFK